MAGNNESKSLDGDFFRLRSCLRRGDNKQREDVKAADGSHQRLRAQSFISPALLLARRRTGQILTLLILVIYYQKQDDKGFVTVSHYSLTVQNRCCQLSFFFLLSSR